ncbi:MAG TPA: fused MFS/spermidine synthase [Nitrospirota bacterium]|nr:fused MFS/spermidine synthase [Nitrospirota bacterium]
MRGNGRSLFFIIFTASGFAGLIYESIWTNYLKLFLGHAAYAQTLVLTVFMGGMALGSWICANYSKRWGNLLLGYALVEAVIGICAVLFHPLWIQFLDLAYTRLIPGLGSPATVTIFQWTTASLFILPQSILLGMTFPLMTAGVIRLFPQNAGATVAMLYFTNSIGAAAGVLAGGFLFIDWWGLPGTLAAAGLINITAAAVVWRTVREHRPLVEKARAVANHGTGGASTITYRVLLGAALLTGASSFIYEIGWIRMLNLVLSSSTHAFELMLCAFITGLALGGLWIRRRIDGLQQPVRFLAFVQMAMGALALATLPFYGHTFEVMAWLIGSLEKTAAGYALFNIASNGIALVIMLPATFCAGMTLPLITAILLRDGQGEKSIGAVYAFNTIGCIIGILFAVHVAMPMLGLKGMLGIGAGIDLALGLALAWWAFPTARIPAIATAAGMVVLLVAMTAVQFDVHKMSSGVYRTGKLSGAGEAEIVFHRDGKTATVSVVKYKNSLSIKTNGKSDASISLTGRGSSENDDESTQIMLGAMPLVLHPHAETAAVIGWGSGMSTAVLLSTPQLDRVDSVEIEPTMVQAAMLFRPRVELAYTDPRSHIHIEDAKTYFSLYNRKYDIIVSEPSNPWVSGVAGLFSKEFYKRIKDHLNEDGLLVQWLQLYEIDTPLVASVFDALAAQFSDYVVYVTDDSDIIVIARPTGTVPEPDPAVLSARGLSNELNRVGINGLQDVLVRRLGNKRALQPLFDSYNVPANSDYYPLLDLYATRALFMGTSAKDLTSNPDLQLLPAVEMLGHEPVNMNSAQVSNGNFKKSAKIQLADMLYGYILSGRPWKLDLPVGRSADDLRQYADKVRLELSGCSGKVSPDEWWDGTFYIVAQCILPYSSPNQLARFWQKAESSSCWSRISPSQKDFIMLLKAVDSRDALMMAQVARKLLEEMPAVHPVLEAYILSAGMLGDLSLGKTQDARSLWEQFGPRLDKKGSQSLLLRLLVAHIEHPARGTVSSTFQQ